jgi:transcriptional regulator of acetoin/glycerol metabolism
MPADAWDHTLSRDPPAAGSEQRARDYLIRIVTCDRPRAGSSRHMLDRRATIKRSPRSFAGRAGDGLELGIPDRRLSSEHCTLVREAAGWVLRDRDSKNGTSVNGERVTERLLADGDLIEAGQTFLVFRERVPTPPEEAVDVDADALRPVAPELATFDPQLAAAFAQLARIATGALPVVVRGPSGTGKELVARAIHARSGRTGPFVAVNCGALADTLVEAELFGCVKGAYSGATQDRTGFVRAAEGGTLFLDEVADLKPVAQPALLRVLQEREVVPVGSSRAIPLDIQIVSATHRDLGALVRAELFREDLAARLFGFSIELPALARRRCDLGLLLTALTARLANGRELAFSADAMRQLLLYSWPANVRELEHVLASAIALAPGEVVELAVLPERLRGELATTGSDPEHRMRDELIALLRSHAGNVSAMARASGWTRMQLHRRLVRAGLDPESFRRRGGS